MSETQVPVAAPAKQETLEMQAPSPEPMPSADPQSELIPDTPESLEDKLRLELEARYKELVSEYGENNITGMMAEVCFQEDVAKTYLDASEEISKIAAKYNNKVRFYVHREPNDEIYIMHSLPPNEFKSNWLSIYSGQEGAVDLYGDQILQSMMLYPKYNAVDWEYNDAGKVYAPMALTKNRLIATIFANEIPRAEIQNDLVFTADETTNVEKLAKQRTMTL